MINWEKYLDLRSQIERVDFEKSAFAKATADKTGCSAVRSRICPKGTLETNSRILEK